jgi:uncharacterized oxidoreductase
MVLKILKNKNITNNMQLTGNKILITGGSSGIGLALAERFLALGNQVIITGRNENKLREIQQKHPNIIIFKSDLTKQIDLDTLALFIEKEHTDLNILINNAGIQYNYQFPQEPDLLAKIDYEIKANFLAPVQLIALLLPTLQQNKNAAIINITSGLGFVPKQSAPVYCGTKGGLHIFTKSLRYQLKTIGIKVFEIIPPLVETPMTEGRGKGKISPEKLVDLFLKKFEKNQEEINIGKIKLLRFLQRISPILADKIMMKQ